jgi:Putative Ig domain
MDHCCKGRQIRIRQRAAGRGSPGLARAATFIAVLLLALLAAPWPARANNFVVLNPNSAGPGSLAQAIIDANRNSGPDTITFAIPGPGPHTIQPDAALPAITDTVFIDGYSQPGSSVNTLPVGTNAVLQIEIDASDVFNGAAALTIRSGGCRVRGLVINRVNGFGNNGAIQANGAPSTVIDGCFIGTNVAGSAALPNLGSGILLNSGDGSTVGGVTPDTRNLISGNSANGILILDSASVAVQGNLVGTNAAGDAAIGNGVGIQVTITSLDPVIGGADPNARNVVSGNQGAGILLGVTRSGGVSGGRIQGNFVGTTANGTAALGNDTGIALGGADPGVDNSQIGGPGSGEGNLISGNRNAGIQVGSGELSTNRNSIQGNFIGTDFTGTAAIPNGGPGIRLQSPGNFIGGTGAGEGNLISGNSGSGVEVVSGTNNPIRGNAIFANGGLGIDLKGGVEDGFGVTANDPGDFDGGPNLLQNYPVITAATSSAGVTTVTGTLNSTPNSVFTLDFYASSAPDPSGFGEGQLLVHTNVFTTDTSGIATFSVTFPSPAGRPYNTVTATDPGSNTSEFSNARITVASNNPPVVTNPGNQTNSEGDTVSLQIVATDPDEDILSYSASGLPPGLGINSGTGLISGTLPYTAAGVYSVTVTASDGSLSDSASFTWTVLNTNRPPVVTNPGNQTNTEGDVVSLSVTATDPDGDPLSYSASGLPPNLTINSTTGLISGTLAAGSAGSYPVTVTASDGSLSGSASFTWTVRPLPPPPAAPDNLAARVLSGHEVRLTWRDRSSNETAFEIQRSTNGGSFTSIGSVGPGVTLFSDRTVRLDNTYRYRVRALGSPSPSGYSNEARASLVLQLVVLQLFKGDARPANLRATLQLRRGADGRFRARFLALPPGLGDSTSLGVVLARARGTAQVQRDRTLVLRLNFQPT